MGSKGLKKYFVCDLEELSDELKEDLIRENDGIGSYICLRTKFVKFR